MTDGQMWYITFDESTIAEKAFEFVNNTLFMGTKLPCEIHQAITNEEYQFLYDNKLQALPPRPPLSSLTEPRTSPSRQSLPRQSHPRQSPPRRSSPQPLSDEELITRATSIILAELRATFIRDLKNRIVTGKVWDLLKEDQRKQLHRAPQAAGPPPLPPSASTSNETNGFLLDAHQTPSLLKLPSFAKRKLATKSNDQKSSTTVSNSLSNLNQSSTTYPYESVSEVSRPLLSRLVEDDATSVASSDQHARGMDVHELLQDDEVNSLKLSDDDEHRSSYSVASTQVVIPVSRVVKKKVRKRFKKAVTFTSSEEEDEEELKPKSDSKRSKHAHNHQSPVAASKHTGKELSLSAKQKTHRQPGSQSPFHDKAMVESSHSPHEDTSIFAPTVTQSSPHTSLTHPDHLLPQSHDENDLNPRPNKKQKRTVKRKRQKPDNPPNAYEHGVAEDEEDLYYIKLMLERLRAGQSPLPPCPSTTTTLADISGSPNKVGSNMPATRLVSRPTDQNPTDGEDDEKTTTGDPLLSHSTGSSRTQGYYHITSSQKASYLPQRNKAIIDVGAITNSNHQNTMALAASRSTRVNSRRFVINMEQNKKATGTLVNTADAVADVLKFNQLRTRKKQLKFARSPIHDWGLYAMEMIPVGEMVIEYVGEVIRQAVADRREKSYERMGIGSSYLFRVDDDLVVDATKKGNLGRLINHCCSPNCTAKIITINGEKKIVIYAKVTIELGDEVTYDYHFPKEDVKIPCLCGSSKCKGTL
ncbi:Setd1a protein, partial [Melampsora americana]